MSDCACYVNTYLSRTTLVLRLRPSFQFVSVRVILAHRFVRSRRHDLSLLLAFIARPRTVPLFALAAIRRAHSNRATRGKGQCKIDANQSDESTPCTFGTRRLEGRGLDPHGGRGAAGVTIALTFSAKNLKPSIRCKCKHETKNTKRKIKNKKNGATAGATPSEVSET